MFGTKPRIKSDMRIIEIGAINAKFLSLKYKLPNKVIAITGEKFGGSGRILEKIPKKIIMNTKFRFMLLIFLNILFNIHFFI
tara:strand:- start:5343 stop:5588 length:246 start_codon:yes stop_codon:yes gene_type:complete